MQKLKIKHVLVVTIIIIAIPVLIAQFINNRYDFTHLIKQTSLEAGTPLKIIRASTSPEGMDVVAENENLELLLNQKTTEIAVVDKRSGQIWFSNPPGRDQDAIANNAEREVMSSQLIVGFYDQNRKEVSYNNYSDSIKTEQFDIVTIKNGVRVTYTLGDLSLGVAALPKYISHDRFQEKVLNKLDKSSARYVKSRYIESEKSVGFWELNTVYENQPLVVSKLLKAFKDAGYTIEEDLAYDNEQAGIVVDLTKDYMVIPIEYQLEEDKLSVTIPTEKIDETGGNRISSYGYPLD